MTRQFGLVSGDRLTRAARSASFKVLCGDTVPLSSAVPG